MFFKYKNLVLKIFSVNLSHRLAFLRQIDREKIDDKIKKYPGAGIGSHDNVFL